MQTTARMNVQRTQPQASVTEVLDRVLDRGIVIDAWLRVSLAGITLIDVDARIVVASIDTYVQRGDAVAAAARLVPTATSGRPARQTEGPARRPTRPRRRRTTVQCESGCTFVRRSAPASGRMRCPSDRGRLCPVTPVPDTA